MSTRILDKQDIAANIDHLFEFLTRAGKAGYKVDRAHIEEVFCPHVVTSSNGHVTAHNSQELTARFLQIHQQYPKAVYSQFLQEPIISENRAALKFDVDLWDIANNKIRIHVAAFVTFDGNHVHTWDEVVSSDQAKS